MRNENSESLEMKEALFQSLESGAPPKKVAKLVVDTFGLVDEEQEAMIQEALESLQMEDGIIVYGDIQNWRRSEIAKA
ncbi:MAG: hypothetical protein AAFR73_10115 [Pseudomonadota bacterium]